MSCEPQNNQDPILCSSINKLVVTLYFWVSSKSQLVRFLCVMWTIHGLRIVHIDCVNNDGDDDEDRSAIILLFFDQKLLHVGLCLLSVGVKHHNL